MVRSVGAALAAILVITYVSAQFAVSATTPTPLAAGEERTYACEGSRLQASTASGTSASLFCVASAPRVTGTTSFSSPQTRDASTDVPSSTRSGDLLVVSAASAATSKLTFASGWRKAEGARAAAPAVSGADASALAGRGIRLETWWKIAGAGEPAVRVGVSPAAFVTMVTVSIRGTDGTRPVVTSGVSPGTATPMLADLPTGSLVISSIAARGTGVVVKTPDGQTRVRDAAVSDQSRLAVGKTVTTTAGSLPSVRWPAENVSQAVAGAVATRSPRAVIPQAATLVPPGSSLIVPCATRSLQMTRLSKVAVTLRCAPASTSLPPSGSATPNPSVSSTQAPTTSPTPAVTPTPGPSETADPSGPPAAPPAAICGSAELAGPSGPPAAAVRVNPGQNLNDLTAANPSGTTFWLAPGTHTLGSGAYDQVIPKAHNTYLGAPGAIIDGQRRNNYAFTGQAASVTIKYLTIQNFVAPNNEGVVNHDSAPGWLLANNTIQTNAGAGVMIGSDNVLENNCIRSNGQYGFNAYRPEGVTNVTLHRNEIAGNNTDDWENREPGCGCSGGGKFWDTRRATVTSNWVHDNKGVGLWADSNNSGFLFKGNYISANDAEGLFYETSYNAAIVDNTFIGNALVKGPTNPGFPASAVYLSESGSDVRAPGPYGSSFEVTGNLFRDNWSGIILWENADRFAGSPANTSSGMTTLVNPLVATVTACGTASLVAKAPYFDDCRWKTQNVKVHDNVFSLSASRIGPSCTANNGCGFNGMFSNYGTYPSWSPYKGTVVEQHITYQQGNQFTHNTYTGPWHFMPLEAGMTSSWATWRSAPYSQDGGSTLN